MCWGGENSFKKLKYWHKNKYNGILQKITARMLLYNFCELVTAHAVVQTAENVKHIYKIHFATPVNICRAYLKNSGYETEIKILIQRSLTPVRSNRKYPINFRPKKFVFLACLRIFSWHR